ncbi:ATP-binding protein [Kitasatospora sp. NPDC006697]|uniref:ATP-binding protein n=1 Tax=Kitasatospora sp. NPDC006697 TaxID=3364020 RepID=UPI00368965DE
METSTRIVSMTARHRAFPCPQAAGHPTASLQGSFARPETPDQSPEPTLQEQYWLPKSRRSPSLARRQLRDFLAKLPDGHRYTETAQLLTSELVTNALLHGTTRDHLIKLTLESDGERLTISVDDASASPPKPGILSNGESGHGLQLVHKLCEDWGRGPREGIGKRVWCVCAPSTL